MLNALEIKISEVIPFENFKLTAEILTNLEVLNEDRWSTVAYLCKKTEILERNFRDLEIENKSVIKTNKNF